MTLHSEEDPRSPEPTARVISAAALAEAFLANLILEAVKLLFAYLMLR